MEIDQNITQILEVVNRDFLKNYVYGGKGERSLGKEWKISMKPSSNSRNRKYNV